MRITMLSLAVALLATACGPSQVAPVNDQSIRDEVEGRFQSLVAAVKSLDHDAYFSHFDERLLTALNQDGTTTDSFETFRSDYLAGVGALAAYQDLEFSNVKVTVIDGQ
ncbi:MAG: hypothetical protein AAFY88_04460, partial [Acidobacteriota bacterium]